MQKKQKTKVANVKMCELCMLKHIANITGKNLRSQREADEVVETFKNSIKYN